MKPNSGRFILILFLLACIPFGSRGLAQVPAEGPQFSADFKVIGNGQSQGSGKFYRGANAARMDMTLDQMSQSQIFRLDKNVVWIVMKEMGMYMEMPLQYNALVNKKWDGFKEECLGNETIEGRITQKCRVETLIQGKKILSLIWKAPDLGGTVVKTVSEDLASGMELKNIKPGPQPETLFGEPAGLKKIQTTGGVADMMETLGGMKLK